MPGKVLAGTTSRLKLVDHAETYGRHLLHRYSRNVPIALCVDLGCGGGDDLLIVKGNHPGARCVGVDCGDWNRALLRDRGLESVSLNIEGQPLPFADETADFVVANQVLEHTKEIFWINHEIFRILKVGGFLYLGVPNLLSLHNRLLGILGVHPTSAKMISAHVRVFSRRDLRLFYREIAAGFVTEAAFSGAQFYPFPKILARPAAALLPAMAFSIFFLLKKTGSYRGEFLGWLAGAGLESNFFRGPAGPAPPLAPGARPAAGALPGR